MAPPLAALCGLVLANALANVIATPLASEARERDQGRDPVYFTTCSSMWVRSWKGLPICRGMIGEQEFVGAVHGSRAFGLRRAAP